jgi:hypothetical protein
MSARGPHSGPLFHPIRRPDRIVAHALARGGISTMLAKRAADAGIEPFSPDDLVRTRSLLTCGQWKANCCSMGMDESPQTASTWPVEPEKVQLAVVRYLARLIPSQRREIHQVLDKLAKSLGGIDALTFPWLKLRSGDLPAPQELRRRLGHTDLSRGKKALNGVLREGVILGLMPPEAYSSVRDLSWNRVKSRDSQDSSPQMEGTGNT